MSIYKRYKTAINIFIFVEAAVLVLVFVLFLKSYQHTAIAVESVNLFIIFSFGYLLYEANKYYKFSEEKIACLEADSTLLSELRKEEEAVSQIIEGTISNVEIEKFLDVGMQRLMDLTGSSWAAFYLVNKSINKLEIKSSLGFSQKIYKQFDITIGEGFVGATALDGKTRIINDIPEDTIYYSYTVLGKIRPKALLLVPIMNGSNNVDSVVVLGSMNLYNDSHVALMERLGKYVAVATLNNRYYNTTQRLSKEIKFQNQLIQDLNNEQEAKISEKTDFLNNIYDSITDYAILSIDGEYKIVYANSSAKRIFNISMDSGIEMIANSEIMVSKLKKSLNFALNSGSAVENIEIFDKNASASLVKIQMYAVYNKNKMPCGVTLLMKDFSSGKIRNPKQQENRALIVTDENGIIESANKITEAVINKKADEIAGINISSFFKDKELIDKLIEDVKLDGNDAELSCLLKDSDKNVTIKVNLISSGKNTKKLFIYI